MSARVVKRVEGGLSRSDLRIFLPFAMNPSRTPVVPWHWLGLWKRWVVLLTVVFREDAIPVRVEDNEGRDSVKVKSVFFFFFAENKWARVRRKSMGEEVGVGG